MPGDMAGEVEPLHGDASGAIPELAEAQETWVAVAAGVAPVASVPQPLTVGTGSTNKKNMKS